MDNASPTHPILDTLRTVEFRLGLKGYNVDEVDEYLEKAAVEAEQVQERLRSANERLRLASERVAQLEEEHAQAPAGGGAETETSDVTAPVDAPAREEVAVTTDTLQRTLLLAQKFVDQTKRESETEAAQLVREAETRARALLSQAEERAHQLTSEAEARLRDEVARLEETRRKLETDVAEMARHLEDQRATIRASLVEVLRWVDDRIPVATGRSVEGAAGGGAGPQSGPRKAPPEGTGRADRSERSEPARASVAPGAPTGPGALVGAAAGASRASATPAATPTDGGVPTRQGPSARSHPSAEATERLHPSAGGDAGAVRGGLFEMGREGATALEGGRLRD